MSCAPPTRRLEATSATHFPRFAWRPASGANNTVREVGDVFGVAVLASVFAAAGSYVSPQVFVNGMIPAIWVGAVAVALAGIAAMAIPPRQDVVPDSVSLLERPHGASADVAADLACEPDAAA